ncbi:hypothetical protein ACHAXS_002807 [Conticribra weissflogii]
MDTAPLDTPETNLNFTSLYDDNMSVDEKLSPLSKLKNEVDPTASSTDVANAPLYPPVGDEADDAGSIHSSEQKLPRHIIEGFIAYNKTFADVELSADACNPVKKDTTASTGKVNHSPRTPLKAIAGTSIQLLKIDDLRMFCSKNKIKGSRKAKKAEVCWAISLAKRQHDAGQPPPYKNPCPLIDGMDDVILRASTAAIGLLSDDVLEQDDKPFSNQDSSKKRKSTTIDPLNAHDSLGGILPRVDRGQNFHGPELLALQQRIAYSIEEKNRSIQIRETIEAASIIRRDLREETKHRATLFSTLVAKSGDEKVASESIDAFKNAKVEEVTDPTSENGAIKNIDDGLIESILKQDELILLLSNQHAEISETVSKLMGNHGHNVD